MEFEMMLGLAGLAGIFLAYLFALFGKVNHNSWAFGLLNVSGGLALSYYTFREEVYSFSVLLFAWAAVSIINMIRGREK